MAPKDQGPIYQLKITLYDSKPPIWRRVLVPGNITLGELHHVIQAAMGWYNCHLHQFVIANRYYGDPAVDLSYEVWNENDARIHQVVPGEGFKFSYEYDFGDGWLHNILVEKILPPDPERALPVCLKGRRACPPEDVGGIWGYYDFLEALQDPNHPEHTTYLEWIGGRWDAEAFDLDETNNRLKFVWTGLGY